MVERERMKIKTTHAYPPIPDRSFDWVAWDDERYCGCGYCKNVVGLGPTEQDAIRNFVEQLEEYERENAITEHPVTDGTGRTDRETGAGGTENLGQHGKSAD